MKLFFWIVLYVSFIVFAVITKRQLGFEGATELWGWDYHTFVSQIQDLQYITYFGFRHPGLGVVLSPLVALEQYWPSAYLVFMPGVALATAYLIFKMAGWIGLVVWLSFPTTWLMAAIPESFPIAQLALVLSFYWFFKNRVSNQREPRVQIGWAFGFSVFNGMITLTNGFKPILAYLVTCRDKRMFRIVLLLMLSGVVLGCMFFYVRSIISGREISEGIAKTLIWVPDERNMVQEFYGFFIRPVGHIQSMIVYPLLIWSLLKLKYSMGWNLILILISYFAIDCVIHFVIGWGMVEPWIFAPHWLFIIPVIIGYGFSNKYFLSSNRY